MTAPMLEIRSLNKQFLLRSGGFFSKADKFLNAINDVNLSVAKGKSLGLVGESGSGKSTLGRLILKLSEPTTGDILIEGESILGLERKELRRFRQKVQMIFQDPFGSLNPRMSVGELISEAWVVHPELRPANMEQRLAELMEQVGLRPEWSSRYPGQFSGGQRQRIGIARALAIGPKLLVCDEAVSALDVSVQAQILKLLRDIQRESGLTYVFISHDLSVVRYISDYVAVMHLGRIVEAGPAESIYVRPRHPYTRALLAAVPSFEPAQSDSPELKGEQPDPINPPSGCMFRTRCWRARPECAAEKPKLVESESEHYVACLFPDEYD